MRIIAIVTLQFDLLYDPIYDYLTAGTMIICHLGCGYYDRLVVTSATRGQIWADGVRTDRGYSPLNLSFLDWYEKWLDEHFS